MGGRNQSILNNHMIERHTDYLDLTSFVNIQRTLFDQRFPYFFRGTVSYDPAGEEKFIMGHRLYDWNEGGNLTDDKYIDILLKPLLNRLQPKTLYRAQVNMNCKNDVRQFAHWHIDQPNMKHSTALYYVNTNNGWTEFETGEKIPCVANSIGIWSDNIRHRGAYQTDEQVRICININYV